ncbi:hypothetical protein JCM10450v2_001309 [Rhodotorula kratochvilovae]
MLRAAFAGAERPLASSSVGREWGDPALSKEARAREWPALKDTVFLDHAASPPAPLSPLTALSSSIASTLFSNPHSASTSGVATHLLIDHTRTRVLKDLFNVPDDRVHEWDVVFVPGGATQAIRTLGDAWEWRTEADMGGRNGYEYLVESHTSLVGLRGKALSRCSAVAAHRTPTALLRSALAASSTPFPSTSFRPATPTLCSYPAQCNATGARLGLRFGAQIKRANPSAAVLVDAAAYSSTSVLDLGSVPASEAPDFVVASVYKIFGFPTSLGILLVRRSSSHLLLRPSVPSYFGGGTLSSLSLSAPFTHTPLLDSSGTVHQALEHGTPPYLEIVALSHALDWLERFTGGGGLPAVAAHVSALRRVATQQLHALRHTGGGTVFVEHAAFAPEKDADEPALTGGDEWAIVLESPGPIIGFSLLLPPSLSAHAGEAAADEPADFRRTQVGHQHLARLALLEGIALRSGGMCNAGAWTRAVGMGEDERRRLEELGAGRCWDEEEFAPFAPFRPLGITRISFGIASTIDDVHTFVSFGKRFFVRTEEVRALEALVPRGVDAPLGASEATAVKRARLTELYIYPIKSCAAQPLPPSSPWPLTPTGLLYDREFMLVSSSTGRALSMKRYSRMALIRPSIDRTRGLLRVEAPGMQPLEVPLARPRATETCGLPTPPLSEDGHASDGGGEDGGGSAPRATTLCSATVLSQRFSSAADAWFTAFLNPPPSSSSASTAAGPGPVELHRLPAGAARHAHFDGASGPPLPLRLSNESPFLLVSGESLRAVNGWIGARAAAEGEKGAREEVRATAFRPNLVVEGAEEGALQPWWEEGIEALRIGTEEDGGGGTFSFLGRCRRCLMVSIDQTTGARTAEPLATLSLKRKNASNGRVEFGAHMLWRDELTATGEGAKGPCVRVGDEMRVQLRVEG